MSAQAGIVCFDTTRTDDAATVKIVSAFCQYWANLNAIRRPGVSMLYCKSGNASFVEEPPKPTSAGARHLLVWDGRLDNADELRRDLCDPCLCNDTDIVIAGYRKWGDALFARLIGDWALSLWNEENSELLLARDYAGVRPLHYYTVRGRVVWASSLEALVTACGGGFELDDNWIAGFMCFGSQGTPYTNISSVPPGHVVSFTSSRTRQWRHWSLNVNREVSYRNDSEYEDHFIHLLRDALRCRLNSATPVWAHLSGGLDSSTIVCVADDLIGTGSVRCPRIETISHVYHHSKESDERDFITLVEQKRNRTGNRFFEEDYPPLAAAGDCANDRPSLIYVVAGRELAIWDAMQRDGATVQLSGDGGDELMGNMQHGTAHQADLLSSGHLIGFWKVLCRWSKANKKSRLAHISHTPWTTSTIPARPLSLTA